MNIINYLEKIKKQNSTELINTTSKKNKCLKKIAEMAKNNSIDLLEYRYMTNFCNDVMFLNMKWLMNILKKINNPDLYTLYSELYPKLFSTNKNFNMMNSVYEQLEELNNAQITYTNDQSLAAKEILEFLYDSEKQSHFLFGFSGSGKTSLFVNIVYFLLNNNYIKSVVFAAPTNKAVKVIKSKFAFYLKKLVEDKLKENINNASIEEQIHKLQKINITVDFMSIHKLLNYKKDFDENGKTIFVKSADKNLLSDKFSLIIIDECSMLSLQVINNVFEEIRLGKANAGANFNKIQKYIFVFDPAQLPAVNEPQNILFTKKMDIVDYKKIFKKIAEPDDVIKSKLNLLINDISKVKVSILKEVVRTSDMDLINMSYNIRLWVLGKLRKPTLSKFIGPNVKIYKKMDGIEKIKSKWFAEYISYCQSNVDKTSSIILAWRNKTCNTYNDAVRKTIFGKTVLNRFEIGDILMLDDYYNFEEILETSNADTPQQKSKFYTSEQIKITDIDRTVKYSSVLSDKLPPSLIRMKDFNTINDKYVQTIKTINKNTTRKYNIYKLSVQKLSDGLVHIFDLDKDKNKKIMPTYQIYVLDEYSKKIYDTEKSYSSSKIKELRQYYETIYKEKITTIEKEIMNQLWREHHRAFVDWNCNVSFGFSITTHNSQASTFSHCWVDLDDIVDNPNSDEARKCVYTAVTRTANSVFIII